MAIVRAGPFASSSDFFLDEPDSLLADGTDPNPVNCANNASGLWPWRYYQLSRYNFDASYKNYTSTAQFDLHPDFVSGLYQTSGQEGMYWYYQASGDFDLTINYEIGFATADNGNIDITFDGPGFSEFDSLNISGSSEDRSKSGSFTVTASETKVPALIVVLLFGGADNSDASFTATIDLNNLM